MFGRLLQQVLANVTVSALTLPQCPSQNFINISFSGGENVEKRFYSATETENNKTDFMSKFL